MTERLDPPDSLPCPECVPSLEQWWTDVADPDVRRAVAGWADVEQYDYALDRRDYDSLAHVLDDAYSNADNVMAEGECGKRAAADAKRLGPLVLVEPAEDFGCLCPTHRDAAREDRAEDAATW